MKAVKRINMSDCLTKQLKYEKPLHENYAAGFTFGIGFVCLTVCIYRKEDSKKP